MHLMYQRFRKHFTVPSAASGYSLLIPLPGGSQLYDAMVNLKQGDLVLLFGYSRLLTEVQILLSYSEKAGYQTILFTDLLAEEHLSNANLTLYSFRGEPNDYHSVATPYY